MAQSRSLQQSFQVVRSEDVSDLFIHIRIDIVIEHCLSDHDVLVVISLLLLTSRESVLLLDVVV